MFCYRVLAPDGEGGAGGSDAEDSEDENGDTNRNNMKTYRPTSFEDDLRALDLAVHVDLHAARRAARGGSLGRGETSLMKAVLVQALYPRVAAPDPNNSSRERESDWRFHARGVRDAVLHPTSTLNAPDHAPAPTEVILFGEMLETHRVFLCNCARAPAHALLLSATNVECDADAERILIDRWLMLRVRTAGGGESLLVAASRLRLALQSAAPRSVRLFSLIIVRAIGLTSYFVTGSETRGEEATRGRNALTRRTLGNGSRMPTLLPRG